MPVNPGDTGGVSKLRRWEKDRHESTYDQVVYLGFGFAEVLGCLQCGNNGEVIRNFRVIENTFVRLDPVIAQNFRRMWPYGIAAATAGHG